MTDIPTGTRLNIATPCYGRMVFAPYVNSLVETVDHLGKVGVPLAITFCDGASISHSRNSLVAKFMASPCSHLLFIDADIEWQVDSVIRLLDATRLPDVEVACGDYSTKRLPVGSMARLMKQHNDEVRHHPLTGFLEARYVPAGFLMIRRSAIERMYEAYPERKCHWGGVDGEVQEGYALFDCVLESGSGCYFGEDFGFSLLWRETGGEIWIDPECQLTHHGLYEYRKQQAYARA